ncbi:MAG: hypothetical protein C0503_12510, partial [Gemmatimonas sp.]|nr:hypothetical protein [Gemmatimonas sp.]
WSSPACGSRRSRLTQVGCNDGLDAIVLSPCENDLGQTTRTATMWIGSREFLARCEVCVRERAFDWQRKRRSKLHAIARGGEQGLGVSVSGRNAIGMLIELAVGEVVDAPGSTSRQHAQTQGPEICLCRGELRHDLCVARDLIHGV